TDGEVVQLGAGAFQAVVGHGAGQDEALVGPVFDGVMAGAGARRNAPHQQVIGQAFDAVEVNPVVIGHVGHGIEVAVQLPAAVGSAIRIAGSRRSAGLGTKGKSMKWASRSSKSRKASRRLASSGKMAASRNRLASTSFPCSIREGQLPGSWVVKAT